MWARSYWAAGHFSPKYWPAQEDEAPPSPPVVGVPLHDVSLRVVGESHMIDVRVEGERRVITTVLQ